jgi:hypothetical protein
MENKSIHHRIVSLIVLLLTAITGAKLIINEALSLILAIREMFQ